MLNDGRMEHALQATDQLLETIAARSSKDGRQIETGIWAFSDKTLCLTNVSEATAGFLPSAARRRKREAADHQSYALRITRIWKTGAVITRNYSVITIQL